MTTWHCYWCSEEAYTIRHGTVQCAVCSAHGEGEPDTEPSPSKSTGSFWDVLALLLHLAIVVSAIILTCWIMAG